VVVEIKVGVEVIEAVEAIKAVEAVKAIKVADLVVGAEGCPRARHPKSMRTSPSQ